MSAVANVTQSPLYVIYKDAGFSWNIAIWALLLNVVGISGQLGNAAVIWVTYRTKSLHGTANFHLALGAFLEMLHQNGHLLFLYISMSGQNFLSYRLAVYFLSASLFAMGSIAISITFTAIDRLLFILFPMITHRIRPAYYLSAVCAICFCCCSWNAYIFHVSAAAMPNVMITGSFDDVLSQQGDAKDSYNNLSLACNGITFVIYLIMGSIIKFKNPMAMTGSARILKSIFVLITVNLSGFAAMRVYRLFIAQMVQPYMLRWYIGETMSVYLNMSTASTGLVLYLTSGEYRNAFRKEFGQFLCLGRGKKMTVSTINRTMPTQTQQLMRSRTNTISVANIRASTQTTTVGRTISTVA